jgi:hypothetical protein
MLEATRYRHPGEGCLQRIPPSINQVLVNLIPDPLFQGFNRLPSIADGLWNVGTNDVVDGREADAD